jgi:endonuclease/exonuclease/phosphatase family metal-dependent hydrolase
MQGYLTRRCHEVPDSFPLDDDLCEAVRIAQGQSNRHRSYLQFGPLPTFDTPLPMSGRGKHSMGTILRAATVNLLNDLTRWTERRSLLADGLAPLALDLIGLQEVTSPLGESTAHWLAGELGGYSVHVSPKTGWGRKQEGIAVLCRLPVEGYEVLDLGSQERTAQVVSVRSGGRPIVFINGHYHWLPGAHGPRVRQVERVLRRADAFLPDIPVIACGDFNGLPGSPAIALMRHSFASAHEAVHGLEPDFTCPTALTSGHAARSAVARGLLRLFSNRPDGPWRGTLDYIFVSPGIRVLQCGVILDRPSPGDPTLFASDHLGVAATLEIPPPSKEST